MADSPGSEPGGWELFRAIQDSRADMKQIQTSIETMGSRMVSAELYKAHLEADAREKKDLREKIVDVREDLDKKIETDHARDDEARRFKANQFATYALGIAALIVSVVLPFIIH